MRFSWSISRVHQGGVLEFTLLHVMIGILAKTAHAHIMAIPVAEFSREGYIIRKIFG
jgi:hypothetical protein